MTLLTDQVPGSSVGGVAALIPRALVVLYDGKDGRVLHVHSVVASPTGPIPDRPQIETKARRMAARFGNVAEEVEALHLEPGTSIPKHPYIDLGTMTLVERARPRAASAY